MPGRKVIIVGSGLGGLECGLLLARRGFDVTVLEQDSAIGGCLRSYRRGDLTLDTGIHCVGDLEEGGELRGIVRELGLDGLPWERMAGEEVVFGDERFFLPSGYDALADALKGYFPASETEIDQYLSVIREAPGHPEWMGRSAYEFLCSTVSDPLLRNVLSGTSLKMHLDAETLPLYVFARINGSFVHSIWRLPGGGQQIADTLAGQIKALGGEVLTGEKVTSLVTSEGRVVEVQTASGMRCKADFVISDAHPAVTVPLVDGGLRRVYAGRVKSLRNSFGMFTASLRLREGMIPYLDRNVYVHDAGADLWHLRTDRPESVMVCFGNQRDGFARSVDLMAPCPADVPDREEFAQTLIDKVSGRFPTLAGAVETVYTSTPRTWERYTATPDGSAYGVMKDWNNNIVTVLSPRTPLENLFLTGQSLALHGVLGVSKTAWRTVNEIL